MRHTRIKTVSVVIVVLLALSVLLTGCGEWSVYAGDAKNAPAPSNAPDAPALEVSYVISFVTYTSETIPSIETRILLLSQIPEPDKSRKPGFWFGGWYTSSDFSGSKVTAGYTFTRNTTLYAKWVENTAIRIENPEQLQAIANRPGADYILAADIDLTEIENWKPIGDFRKNKEFSGTFDGNGYVIRGMKIHNLEADEEFNFLPVGLFGKVTGTVRNVSLVDYSIEFDGDQSRFYIGGIVGWLCRGSLINCTASGTIDNPEIIYEGTIWDSVLGSYATPTTSVYVGGAVGYVNGGIVSGVSTEGRITSASNEEKVYFGGLAGYVNSYTEEGENYSINEPSTIRNCNSKTNVFGRYSGGLIGYNDGKVTSCFAMGKASGSLSYPAIAGGLIGYNYNAGSIYACYATGATEARTAGGLVGVNIFDFKTAVGGTISNSYASGNVFASEYGGGLVGRAVSDLPYMGRPDFNDKVFDESADHKSGATTFFMIECCLSFGSVEVNATETEFKDYLGDTHKTNVFYPVFAGSFVGQAYELYIKSCISFGDVAAISNRKSESIVGDETYAYNIAYADNFVGHSTSRSTNDFVYVFAAPGITVTRNNTEYDGGEDSVQEIGYNYLNDAGFYRSTLNFSADVWDLENLNVAAGIYPVLKMS